MDARIYPTSQLIPSHIETIPGDKSISHRAIILGALSSTPSTFTRFLTAEDCLNTLSIFRELGVPITQSGDEVTISGVGLAGLRAPECRLDTGNSGTGIRLITGVLAGQRFSSTITGDKSIQGRPMRRVVEPLTQMGARISGCAIEGRADIFPPLTISGAFPLNGIRYRLPVASAQVKSAVLLAGLFADSPTVIEEPELCRDHSERMLKGFGADILRDGELISLAPGPLANPRPEIPIRIPADFSSAAFFLVLGTCGVPVTLTGVGLNPTRDSLLHVLLRMGANIQIIDRQGDDFEPYGTLVVAPSPMENVEIFADEIPFIIDEIPILAVAALFSKGTLRVRNAAELRVKESDRIAAIGRFVAAMGGRITEFEDGFELAGPVTIQPFDVESGGDHRIAMASIIAAVCANVSATVRNCECINTSFPNFFDILSKVGRVELE